MAEGYFPLGGEHWYLELLRTHPSPCLIQEKTEWLKKLILVLRVQFC
jgi:hypothetical protein